jgi:hypothetical protein
MPLDQMRNVITPAPRTPMPVIAASSARDPTAWLRIQDSSLQVAYRKMRFDV